MIYLSTILLIVALVFAVLRLVTKEPKIDLVGWALLLLAIAALLDRVPILIK